MTIKVLEKTPECLPEDFKVGDWYDLFTAEDVHMHSPFAKTLHYRKKGEKEIERTRDVLFDFQLIKLGICMQLPKGYEAILAPRSSAFKKFGILQTNSIGVIDNLYRGNNDEWKMAVMGTRNIIIPKGTRIAQFRIQLSQKATFIQKLRWLFTSKIRFKRVFNLSNADRGGFGEGTDKK